MSITLKNNRTICVDGKYDYVVFASFIDNEHINDKNSNIQPITISELKTDLSKLEVRLSIGTMLINLHSAFYDATATLDKEALYQLLKDSISNQQQKLFLNCAMQIINFDSLTEEMQKAIHSPQFTVNLKFARK